MLFELGNTRQERSGPRRRWFTSPDCDLILWLNDDESLWGFQFCYDKPANEHALTWARDFGFSHMRVDTGGPRGTGNAAPLLVLDGQFDAAHILGAFEKEAQGVPEPYREFVVARVRELAERKRA
jgi:hypothetical protein